MSEELYLVAHVVRGSPAFDIAIQMQVNGFVDPWWIIPTSGHRCHPYWSTRLNEIGSTLSYPDGGLSYLLDVVPSPPSGHPDHYPAHDKSSKPAQERLTKINLEELGL